jgi:hypothetical protein
VVCGQWRIITGEEVKATEGKPIAQLGVACHRG